jgi:protein SCO1
MLGAPLRVLVVALVLLVGAMMLMPRPVSPPAPENATVLPLGLDLPEIALIDHDGRAFTTANLRGDFHLLFFGFTNCPDVCPLTLQLLSSAVERIAAAAGEAPQVVFVSVDPQRDTPERIRQYVHAFNPSFLGVTGDDAALAPLLSALGVAVQRHEHDGAHYNVVHNGTVYLVGPRSEVIAVSSPPHDPHQLARDFGNIRSWYTSSRARDPVASTAGATPY